VGVAAALLIFFTAFNVLEATLPSMISKIAPLSAKAPRWRIQQRAVPRRVLRRGGRRRTDAVVGGNAVFWFSIVLLALWLAVVSGMRPPAAVRTRLYHLEQMSDADGVQLQQCLAQLQGVREAMVVAAEGMACIKVEMQGFDEAAVEQLVKKGA